MLWEYFQKGGFIMYPLLTFSVLALGLSLERAFYFMKLNSNPKLFFDGFSRIKDGDSEQVESKLKQLKDRSLKTVLLAIWNDRNQSKSDLEALAREESEEQVHFMERNLKTLSVIAILSPLVGLLGTVLGIMKAFLKTSEAAKIDPTLLAGGIWEALITTFVGLSIAIPTWAVYYYFTHKVEKQVFHLEFFSSRFLRLLRQKDLIKASS